MLLFLEFILLFTSLFYKSSVAGECRSSFSVTDHVLTGHVMRTLNHKTFESCTFSCELEPKCFSVNFISLHKTCQLNDATKNYFPGDLVKQKGAFYMGMVIRSYNPCASMRCENGGTCVHSPTLKCKCLTGFSGHHCERYNPCANMSCENGGTCVLSPSLQCKCLKGFSGPNCKNLQALGMENNHIPDASIQATSEKLGYEAAKGRLNGNSCWMPTQNKNTEHLRVDFATKVTIVAIATQGSPIDDCWVERYSFQWFHDGNLFDGPKEFQANTNQNTTKTNKLANSLVAVDWIRIRPQSWLKCIAMRLELYGYEQ